MGTSNPMHKVHQFAGGCVAGLGFGGLVGVVLFLVFRHELLQLAGELWERMQ